MLILNLGNFWNYQIYSSGAEAPLGQKCHVKNRKYGSLDLEIDPS
jgi:hypothetical protein